MEVEEEIFYTKTGRPYIMTEYVTSLGNKAHRARFIKMLPRPDLLEAEGLILPVIKKPRKVGGKGSIYWKNWEHIPEYHQAYLDMLEKIKEAETDQSIVGSGVFDLLKDILKDTKITGIPKTMKTNIRKILRPKTMDGEGFLSFLKDTILKKALPTALRIAAKFL